MPKIFADVSEKEISRSIAGMFMETMNEYTDSEVIIIGAGPAGLSAGRELGRLGIKVLHLFKKVRKLTCRAVSKEICNKKSIVSFTY